MVFRTGKTPTGVDLDLKSTYAVSMNMVEFRVTEPAREAEGILEIGRRMRVSCLEGDRFLVAEEGLAVLDRLGIAYTLLTREPFNYERHALSPIAGAQISRRLTRS